MTDHRHLNMQHEQRRITDKAMVMAILDQQETCCVALHDEPYPYVVPMNFGYQWEDDLVFYLHMATEGHRIQLIRQNPRVAVSVWSFLDRIGYAPFRNETHDYRSVTAYGRAEIIPVEQEEEYLRGLSVLCVHTGRPPATKITAHMGSRMLILKVRADFVSGKAQYPISTLEEVAMPPLGGERHEN